MIVLAAHHEPNAGWGKLLALIIAGGLFYLGSSMYERYLKVKDQPLSPAGDLPALESVKPQVTAGPDTKMTPSPTGPPAGGADLDGFVRDNLAGARTKDIVRAARGQFGVSRATVMRALRRARGSGT